MAATHLSRIRPHQQSHYATMAAEHQSAAGPEFRTALQRLGEDNYQALISYLKGLVWCSFAEDPEFRTRPGYDAQDSWLPGWFRLLHGSCCVVESARAWLQDGPNLLSGPGKDIDFTQSPEDQQICAMLNSILAKNTSITCNTVLQTLREAFARSALRHENPPLRNAMNFWIGSLPFDYIQLLRANEAWALVVLSHFCILVHRSDTVWYMKGHATSLMQSIVQHLDSAWLPHIVWPLTEIMDGRLCY